MKKVALLLLVFANCLYAQRKPKIKGNRNVVTVSENLPAFNAIELNSDLDIVLQKSSGEGYIIMADDNLFDVLKFEVQDSTLLISSFYNITAKKKLEITINYVELEAILLRDGKMEMTGIVNAEKLYINTFGKSKLQLNANADEIEIAMEGNSSGDFNIDSDSLNINLRDKIDVKMYAVGEKTRIEMSKNASIKIEGTTSTLNVILVENANLKASNFEASNVFVDLDGSPSARVHANKDFELVSKGTSKTFLYGDPVIIITEFLNKSQLHKEEH